jgi:hypothetical protein
MNWTTQTEHYRKKYLIPKPLQGKVCMCDDPGPVDKSIRYMNHCSTCHKPYRWYVRICTVCKQHFIKDFRRQNLDCAKHTKCWDHLQNECDCDKEKSNRVDYGPLGINPKHYTAEELKGTFSFDSPF